MLGELSASDELRLLELDLDEEKLECEKSLAAFIKSAWHIIEPGTKLQWNWHLDTVAGYLEAFHRDELPDKRLIINIPPGTMKSIIVTMYSAWSWIEQPHLRFLAISNEGGLATRDSLRMKQIITSTWYQRNWAIGLQPDQNEKTLFVNSKRGFRQSQGITGCATGKRGDVLILDDLIDAKHAFSDVIRQSVNDTWDQSLTSRLNDLTYSGVILIMQRLHESDITGHLLKKVKSKWTHLKIPMRYEGIESFDAAHDIGRPELNDPRTKKGELLFLGKFPKKAVEVLEEDLGEYGVAGQLQQRPVPTGGGIIKKQHWRQWADDVPLPKCQHIFTSYDTAFSEKDSKTTAYSACTRWGVFWHSGRERYCVMLLGVWYDRVGYPELRAKVVEIDKKYNPDVNLIEAKATGLSLLQDLRDAVSGTLKSYSPGKGEDKISRAHSVTPILEMGLVYVPPKKWANELIDYVASFPHGAPPSADLTDTVTQALIYLRKARWFENHDDETLENERKERDRYAEENRA